MLGDQALEKTRRSATASANSIVPSMPHGLVERLHTPQEEHQVPLQTECLLHFTSVLVEG